MGYYNELSIEGNYDYAFDPNRTIGDRMSTGGDTFQMGQRVRIAFRCDPLAGREGVVTVAQKRLYQVRIGYSKVWAYAGALEAIPTPTIEQTAEALAGVRASADEETVNRFLCAVERHYGAEHMKAAHALAGELALEAARRAS